MFNLILLYYGLSIGYIIFYYFRKKKNWFTQSLILLLCPGIGIILLIGMNREYREKSTKMPDWLIKKNEGAEHETVLIKPDMDRELSVVPINDTLILNDDQLKRRALLNLLKKDTIDNVHILSNALINEDSETAHYAATAIMEIKRNMLNSIYQLEQLAEKNHNDLTTLKAYAESLQKFIYSNFLDDQSKKIYMYKYSMLLGKIIEISPYESKNYLEKINCDIELKEFENVEFYCSIFIKYCPNVEEAYFTSMKFFYLLKDKHRLKQVLNQLMKSTVKISPEGMKILRYWINELR